MKLFNDRTASHHPSPTTIHILSHTLTNNYTQALECVTHLSSTFGKHKSRNPAEVTKGVVLKRNDKFWRWPSGLLSNVYSASSLSMEILRLRNSLDFACSSWENVSIIYLPISAGMPKGTNLGVDMPGAARRRSKRTSRNRDTKWKCRSNRNMLNCRGWWWVGIGWYHLTSCFVTFWLLLFVQN